MGHGLKECNKCSSIVKEKADDDLPYSLALKAESNVLGKENLQFGFIAKK